MPRNKTVPTKRKHASEAEDETIDVSASSSTVITSDVSTDVIITEPDQDSIINDDEESDDEEMLLLLRRRQLHDELDNVYSVASTSEESSGVFSVESGRNWRRELFDTIPKKAINENLMRKKRRVSPKKKLKKRNPKKKVSLPASFTTLLKNTDFFLSIDVVGEERHGDCFGLLGSFPIYFDEEVDLINKRIKDKKLYLYMKTVDDPSGLYGEEDQDIVLNSDEDEEEVSEIQTSQHLVYSCRLQETSTLKSRFPTSFFQHLSQVSKTVFGLFVRIPKEKSSSCPLSQVLVEVFLRSSYFRQTDINRTLNTRFRSICHVMRHLFQDQFHCFVEEEEKGDRTEPPIHFIEKFFHCVKQKQQQSILSLPFFAQSRNLLPQLRPYQEQAVKFMLNRETFDQQDSCQEYDERLFTEMDLSEAPTTIFYNQFYGYFSLMKPQALPFPSGGILADEMGLGKTVEVLALILANRAPVEEEQTFYSRKSEKSHFNFKYRFDCDLECFCGKFEEDMIDSDEEDIIKCYTCSSAQHASCASFDVKRHGNKRYFCPHCWASKDKRPEQLKSRATFIISPRSICHQWIEEIERHIDPDTGFKVFYYEGINAKGYIQPYDIADNDVVISSYETFVSEMNYIDLKTNHCLRNKKRFNSTPSPLTSIDFWRICLDEAQMVESSSSKAAEMALRIESRFRWCVTGTPVSKSINDLYGLFLFLGVDPYDDKKCWKHLIYDSYCQGNSKPLESLLSTFFWRTSKKEAKDQLDIPPMFEMMKFLEFGPIERHFYQRQRDICAGQFGQVVAPFKNLNVRLNELDRKTAVKIMAPLLTLRQACCHPQVVKGKFTPLSKKTLTMEELLDNMIKNTKYECEEEHRKVISSLNGQAGISLIKNEYEKAVQIYRSALQSVQQHKEEFRTDKLQQIHTLDNLAYTLEMLGIQQKEEDVSLVNQNHESDVTESVTENISSPGREASPVSAAPLASNIPRTLRDEFVRLDAEKLRKEYLKDGVEKVEATYFNLQEGLDVVEEIVKKFVGPYNTSWLLESIKVVTREEDADKLIKKVKDTLAEHALRDKRNNSQGGRSKTKFVSIGDKFRDLSGMKFILSKLLQELSTSREKLVKQVTTLPRYPDTQDIVNNAIDCHLRPRLDKNGNRIPVKDESKCQLCLIHDCFNDYEGKLFYFSQEEKSIESMIKDEALMENLRRGTWGDSETEQSLKAILAFIRLYDSSQVKQWVDLGSLHMKFFESLKKEFRLLRSVWMTTFDFISKLDELNMASLRLRIRMEGEPKPVKTEKITYILEEFEIDSHLSSFKSDEELARHHLRKKMAHLFFLRNLKKASFQLKDGVNEDECPICISKLGREWCVMMCSHCLCLECLDALSSRSKSLPSTISAISSLVGPNSSIKCPVCRQMTKINQVQFVNTTAEAGQEDQVKVEGSWSSKVEQVVRSILTIIQEEECSKILVFSAWTDVLILVSQALQENQVLHVVLKTGKKFWSTIESFKTSKSISVMLLPYSCGGKGLNLIEANHIFLIEPVLNHAIDVQAIGRIHRIGQKKNTFVHRFLVTDSIEERIYTLIHKSHSHGNKVMKAHDLEEDQTIELNNEKDEMPNEQESMDILDMTPLESSENVITINELIDLFQAQSN